MLDKQHGRNTGLSHDTRGSTKNGKSKGKSKTLTSAEQDEEDEIAWLEAMLGVGGSKKSGKSASRRAPGEEDEGPQDEDGFDELLGELDRFYPGMYESGEESEADTGDDDDDDDDDEESSEEDIASDVSEEDDASAAEAQGEDVSDSSSDSSVGDHELSDLEDDESGLSVAELDTASRKESDTSISARNDDHEDTEELDQNASSNAASTSASGRYVPPAGRQVRAGPESSVETQKIQRQLKGLLNRMGDNNIDGILTSIEGVYGSHKRAEVTQSLIRLILDTIAARSAVQLTDTFTLVYASLVAALYRVVGVDFAAAFLQAAVDDLLRHYRKAEHLTALGEAAGGQDSTAGEDDRGKELTNITSLICHLYNLRMIACPLVYDLIRLFLGLRDGAKTSIGEADVELLLKIIKTCGTQLHQDDPTSLKQIVTTASDRAVISSSSSSRVRFMLETMTDVKSSRAKTKAAAQNSPALQMLENMRRYLGSLSKKRSTRSNGEPLRLVLKDLEEAESKGKWWLVGSAWKGNEAAADGDDESATTGGVTAMSSMPLAATSGKGQQASTSAQTAQMEAIARKHGMNTPSRRLIFTTLMDPNVSDYSEAAQSLLELRLSDTQRREVIRVLLHCLGREQVYNPYYALVGAKLGSHDPGTRITMQFCLWDYLREIGEENVGGKTILARSEDHATQGFGDDEVSGDASFALRETKLWHLSKAYGWWIAKGCLSLSILRTVDFASMHDSGPRGSKRRGLHFLQLLLLHMLLSTQSNNPSSLKCSSTAPDRRALEEVLIGGTRGHRSLIQGLQIFFSRNMGAAQTRRLIGGKGAAATSAAKLLEERAAWASKVAQEVLEAGAGVLGR
ncbi:unnamed protein product [Parajaminaea phylloscopi]